MLRCGVWDSKRSTDQEGSSYENFTEPAVREYNDSWEPMVFILLMFPVKKKHPTQNPLSPELLFKKSVC